jgi:hypothetical protein
MARKEVRVIVYRVLYKDYQSKACTLLGELRERRKDMRGMTHTQAGLKWARMQFGESVRDRQALLVVVRNVASQDMIENH